MKKNSKEKWANCQCGMQCTFVNLTFTCMTTVRTAYFQFLNHQKGINREARQLHTVTKEEALKMYSKFLTEYEIIKQFVNRDSHSLFFSEFYLVQVLPGQQASRQYVINPIFV